ncbi:N-acetyl-gamma-glutamyl-phosphate reductase [Myxococcota bacterium]|nr:N-acetyl-gamma-glutamyl-phosphate reductase [Myxococcota bacterium]
MEPLRVAVVGASGYTGAEFLRLARLHPALSLTRLCAESKAGLPLSEVLPPFHGIDLPPLVRFDAADVAAHADFAVLGLPHGAAQDATAELLAAGVRVVDMSADHRFSDPDEFARIYGPHRHPANLAETVYGLPELNRERLRTTRLAGCAGCYPTSVVLAVTPALEADLLATREVIADSKSGVSGAGRTPGAGTHFPETAEGLHAYKTFDHRHAPEISRALGGLKVRFTPHLVPMNRGILSTVYLRLRSGIDLATVRAAYERRYAHEPFVRVLPAAVHPDTRHVRGSNLCHLGLFVEDDLLCVQTVIDNLTKGAAGQALQCLNLMAGLPETTGLDHTALFP